MRYKCECGTEFHEKAPLYILDTYTGIKACPNCGKDVAPSGWPKECLHEKNT